MGASKGAGGGGGSSPKVKGKATPPPELGEFGLFLANGAPCESFLDMGNRRAFDNAVPTKGDLILGAAP
jgi:hypothetical protein